MLPGGLKLACSFCGKQAADVAKLVAGPRVLFRRRVYICDECIAAARRIIEESDGQRRSQSVQCPERDKLNQLKKAVAVPWPDESPSSPAPRAAPAAASPVRWARPARPCTAPGAACAAISHPTGGPRPSTKPRR